MKKFSIVVTVYKNELNLPITIPEYLKRVKSFSKDYEFEFIYVNDGSPDNSLAILKEFQKQFPKEIKILNLTRNFGQAYALMAGFSYASGDVVGYITSDMQDPIELFEQMLEEWEKGTKLVIAAREDREESGLGAFIGNVVHRFVNKFIDKKFPQGGFDFFLADRIVVEQLLKINEKNGTPTILLLWMGYEYRILSYTRKKREIGKSSWTLSKKIKLAIDIFTTNTYLPLRLISVIGILSSLFSFIIGVLIILQWLIADNPVRGWTSTVLIQVFFSGLILLSLGTIGEYLWRIFDYVKNRPNYLIDEVIDTSSYSKNKIKDEDDTDKIK